KLKETGNENALQQLDAGKMVEQLKRRIDPNDLYNVTIRPVGGNTRYEIILPTGGSHQAKIKEEAWQGLLAEVRNNPEWKDALAGKDIDVDVGHESDLVYRVRQALEEKSWPAALVRFKEKYADKLKDK